MTTGIPLYHLNDEGNSQVVSAHIPPVHSQTPVRSIVKKSSVLQPLLNSDSSNGSSNNDLKPGNQSDPRKSFLHLNNDSSPSVPGDSTTSHSDSPTTRTMQHKKNLHTPPSGLSRGATLQGTKARYDAESSFFSMTSPLTSRNDLQEGKSRYRDENIDLDQLTSTDSISRRNIRESRLGTQMGRTSSAQSAQSTNSYDRYMSPDSPADTSIDSILSRRPTPTRRAHGKRIENAIEKLMLTSQKMGFESSPSDRHAIKTSLKTSPSKTQLGNPLAQRASDSSKSEKIEAASSPNVGRLARLNLELQAGKESKRQAAEDVKAVIDDAEKQSSSPQMRSSVDTGVGSQGRAKKVGRLSRLQYNKSDAGTISSRPAWDTSERAVGQSRVTPINRSAPRLHGQASNPSLLSEFKREDTSPSSDKSDLDTQRSSSVMESRDYQESSSVLPSSPRSAERRELLLPALSGMRIAVENAVTLPSESFIRGVRRRSSAALLQQKAAKEDTNVDDMIADTDQQKSIPSQVSHQAEPPQGWQVEAGEFSTPMKFSPDQPSVKRKAIPKVNIMSSSSSPQMPTSPSKAASYSLEKKAASRPPRAGKLSDEAIVQLGATSGVDPATLLNANGQALSSKNILTIALQKAQSAVSLDGENRVGEAILAYQQAVRLLEEVMDRVNPSSSSSNRRKSSREEERRRLKVIHDTYADRIRLLSIIYTPEETITDGSGGDIGENVFVKASPSTVLVEIPADRNSTALHYELREEVSTGLGVTKLHPTDTEDRGEVRGIASLGKHTAMDRSDSDRSFRSAVDRRARLQEPTSTFLQTPQFDTRLASGRSSTDGIHVPPTPYYDVEQEFSSNGDHLQPTTAQLDLRQDRSPSLSERMLHPERKKSRSPVDRLARGMSSLNNVPSARDIAATERASHQQKSRRFLSVGSRALLEKEMSSGRSSSSSQHDDMSLRAETPPYTDVTSSTPAAKGPPTSATIVQRPRATTLSIAESNRRLVNHDVAGGTINQRRRLAADDGSLAAISGDEGKTIDANEYSSRAISPTRAQETLKDRHMISRTSPIAATLLSDDEVDSRDSSRRFSLGRKRASSQPGNRRPSIPLNFLQHPSGSPNGPPPVPQIKRKASMPLSPLAIAANGSQGMSRSPASALSNSFSGLRNGSPAIPMSPGYHALGTPLTPLQYPWPGLSLSSYSSEGKSGLIADIFGTSLPSMQIGAIPSFTTNSYAINLPWLGITNSLPDCNLIPQAPRLRSLRPFYTMRQLQISIERGAYISKRLYIPRDLWLQSGSRLLAIETKVRMVDSIIGGIDGIEQSGRFLLHPMQFDQPGLTAIDASKFLKLLEDFDLLLIEVQNTLAKKLGFLETVRGKKGGGLGVIGSKFTRSLDRMTHNSKSMDSSTTYVDGLHRLFIRAQVLGDHLSTLERSKNDRGVSSPIRGDLEVESYNTDNYATLPSELKRNIETRLLRCSDFFANVVIRFVLRDVAILMDKSVKRNTALLIE